MAEEMKIKFSKYDEMLPLASMKESPYQRNTHPKEQIERLAKIMREHGVRHPISISNRTNTIAFGHGRRDAALLNQWTEYPVIYQDFDSDHEEYLCVQSDNAIASWAELDMSRIQSDLKDLPDFDHDLLGLRDFVIEPLIEKVSDEDEVPEDVIDEDEAENEPEDLIPDKIEPRVKPGESYRVAGHQVLNGDCLKVLKSLPDNSIDSLVTDPPAGIAFMGKEWDEDKGGSKEWIKWMTDVMSECLRVMKPGAHGLVWAIPRTSHWTATALEDAGFEIRDVVTHLFGSGFPKSLDISKAIDKAAGAEREVIGKGPKLKPMNNGSYGSERPEAIETIVTAPATPEAKQWQGFGTALKPASEHWILVRKPISEKTVAANVLKHGTGGINIDASRIEGTPRVPINAGTEATGSGSSIMGSSRSRQMEYAANPPSGRFPSNLLLSHNPDCVEVGTKKVKGGGGGKGEATPIKQGVTEFKTNQNRSLVTHRENGTETVAAWECSEGCAVAMLDEQSGILKTTPKSSQQCYGKFNQSNPNYFPASSGGASRFFYCAKPSKREKNAGLEGMPIKQTKGGGGTDGPGDKFGSVKAAAQNFHPTVKSTKLMSYLIKMVTPPDGTVLDCFGGSGSTLVSAHLNHFSAILIEQSPEYCDIILARAEHITEKSAVRNG